MAAMYLADILCDDCAERTRNYLWSISDDGATYANREDWEEANGLDDEHQYDSHDYPKRCDDDEESDSPDHCAEQMDCINAEELFDGGKIGYFFGNSLTSEGADYVKATVREDEEAGFTDSVACTIWKPFYDWIDYDDCEEK